MKPQGSSFQLLVCVLGIALLVGGSHVAAAQALQVERFPGGCELLYVTQTLTAATTLAWPGPDGVIESRTFGQLNLVPDVEAVLSELEPPPPAVVVVGGSQLGEVAAAIGRVMAERMPGPVPPRRPSGVEPGSVERRLGPPEAGAVLRLEVPLPPPDDWRRSTVEVLWELLPELLAAEHEGFRSRLEGDVAVLQGPIEGEQAELELRRLRLAIARIGDSPALDPERVEAARLRLEIRRRAELSTHPDGAVRVAERWLGGGVAAVRELLFGVASVTEASVREAARSWLPQHPGHAVMVLPPRVLNPRFAPGPEVSRLANDATVAILERSVTELSVVVLRPILLPDVDGELTATVLTRIATALRAAERSPGWVRVTSSPPTLELASEPDGLPELVEMLQDALDEVAADDRPIGAEGGTARRRALQLMAGVLGLTESGGLSPSSLLRPSNLAVGVVAPDAETAADALDKFRLGGSGPTAAMIVQTVQPVPRTREAAPGDDSVLVAALDVGFGVDDVTLVVASELLARRLAAAELADSVEVVRPLVPGQNLLLAVLRVRGPLATLEKGLGRSWTKLKAAPSDAEVAAAARAVAARSAADASGALGQARRCAAVAAGVGPWRGAEDLERVALGVTADELAELLAGLPAWSEVATTGAGVLPVPGAPPR